MIVLGKDLFGYLDLQGQALALLLEDVTMLNLSERPWYRGSDV